MMQRILKNMRGEGKGEGKGEGRERSEAQR